MPELPDIAAYITALEARVLGQPLERVRVASVFLLRTVNPPLSAVEGKIVQAIRRIGKRIAIGVEGEIWLVLHLMIAGRLHWRPPQAKLAGRNALAAFDFPHRLAHPDRGRKQAPRFLIRFAWREGSALHRSRRRGNILEPISHGFRDALTAENRTLKRALTDPRLISGVGNAYSDEILHAAHLSPITLTQSSSPRSGSRLFAATRSTLTLWIDRLRAEAEKAFPEKVTAFRPEMAVHGRFGQPCPRCGARSSAFATQTTRPTTAPVARPAERSWPTAAFRGYSEKTGRAPSMN